MGVRILCLSSIAMVSIACLTIRYWDRREHSYVSRPSPSEIRLARQVQWGTNAALLGAAIVSGGILKIARQPSASPTIEILGTLTVAVISLDGFGEGFVYVAASVLGSSALGKGILA
jgi:hypothetical protein